MRIIDIEAMYVDGKESSPVNFSFEGADLSAESTKESMLRQIARRGASLLHNLVLSKLICEKLGIPFRIRCCCGGRKSLNVASLTDNS